MFKEKNKSILFVVLTLFFIMVGTSGAVSAADDNSTMNTTTVPAYTNVYVQISNNVSFNSTGNNTYYIQQTGGGLNAVHIANNSAATTNTGGTTFTSNQSGTLYATDTGGRGYQDDVVLLLAVQAVNGTIPDDFAVTITVNGYNWVPTGVVNAAPALDTISSFHTTLSQTFTKVDFLYGPQNWRPSGYSSTYAYPIYLGENMSDPSNMFYLLFIDTHAGLLGSGYPGGNSQFINNGAVEINYNFTNLQSLASFNIYAYNANTTWGPGMQWTNSINPSGSGGPSGYVVYGISPAVANFTVSTISGAAPLDVQFTDTSSNNPTSWTWDFGDGSTSTEENPTHTYSTPGTYTVSLTAANSAGNSTQTQTNLITVNWPAPTANFTSNVTSGFAALPVQFNDASKGNVTGWFWDFGDGSTSTEKNPTHTYSTSGTYTVTLTVTGPGGNSTLSQTGYIGVFNSTSPSVTATPDGGAYNSTQYVSLSVDQPGSTVYYTTDGSDPTDSNNSSRVPYSGPIPLTSTTNLQYAAVNTGGVWSSRNSKYYYIDTSIPTVTASPAGGVFNGTQTVTLTVNDEGNATVYYTTDGSDPQSSSSRTVYTTPITVNTSMVLRYIAVNLVNNWSPEYTQNYTIVNAPVANFTVNKTSGSAPLNVQFTDTSSNSPTSWLWTFGDGTNSTQENPTHNYTKPGTYTVTLTATNSAGNNTITRTNYITAIFTDAYVSPTGSDTTGDGSSSNPYATIQTALNNVVAGGTIHLASGTYTGTGNVALTITKNVTIVGENQAILNGANTNTIFTVNSGVNVTFTQLKFTGGKGTNGGAIYNSGTLTLNNCTFSTNSASSMGGAIYSTSTLNVNGCTFSSNTVITKGGAIYNTGTLNVNNSIFTGNMATSNHGGAIFNQGTATVNNTLFVGNIANLNGGAIFDQGTLTVRFSSFVNNRASSGSSIYRSSGTVNVDYNWWGSNSNPSSQVTGITINNWLYMTETVNPTTIGNGSTGTVTVSFNNVFNGTNVTSIDPVNGHILDGTQVSFSSVLGSLNPVTALTKDGIATTILTANDTHIRPIYATTDNQTVFVYVNGIGTTISTGNATCLMGNTVNLTATLNNVNGSPLQGQTVTFTVNGSSYSAITDENGVATLNYTPTKPGTYNVTVSFAGDATYGDSSKTAYLTVQLMDAYVLPTGSDTTGDGTLANPYATIQNALNNVATGGTIHLGSGTFTGTGNVALTITKNVNIVGENQATTIINGANANTIFTVNSGLNVKIVNLTIANGTTISGGAIFNAANLNMTNCTLTTNTATSSGGAIYNTGTLTLTGCTLNNNLATYSGGAISNSGTLNITNTSFNANSSPGTSLGGGAIFNQGTLNVHFSSFVNNQATSGSTIYRSSGTVNATYNWWGSNNNPSSQFYGTVDYSNWLYMTLTVDPTTIASGNTGMVTVSFNNACNGTNVTSINPVNGHITDGTLVNFSSVIGSFNPVTGSTANGVATTTFTANNTSIKAINAITDNQIVTIYINGMGTVIAVVNSTCNNATAVNLTATLTSLNGTALAGETVTFTVNGSSYNTTTNANGVATVSYTPTRAGVYSVTASFSGDLNYGDSSKIGYLTVQLNDVYVSTTGNDVTGDGSSGNPFATIQYGTNCAVNGGTVHLASGTYTGTGNMGLIITRNVTIVGENPASTILNGQKSSNFFTVNSGVNVTIANLTLANGTATNGGAISNNGILSANYCNFNGNTANNQGGAIYNFNGATATFNGCNFINNIANISYGGALYNYNCTATLYNCNFINNNANTWGGAICNAWNGTLNMINCAITNNSVTSQGGAIANVGVNAILNLTNCNLSGNTATSQGGAIYNNGIVNAKFTSFVNNNAPSGSAIYLAQGTVNAQNNWWGSNNNPSSQIYGNVTYGNWLYMTETVNQTAIANGSTVTVTVSFNNIWNGTGVVSIDPASGHITDGTLVNFSSPLGSFDHTKLGTVNGVATVLFTANILGSGVINATTNNQIVSADVAVFNNTPVSVTATPDAGTYNSSQTVTLTSDQPGSTIYYTTNGSDPTDASNPNRVPYTVPIQIYNNTVLNFAAVNSVGAWSIKYTKNYTILQQDVYVSPTGSDLNGIGTIANPFATIQTGLNNLLPGGTLHLLAGTYTGTGDHGIILTRDANLVGENPNTTIIDGTHSSVLFTVQTGVTVTFENITLANATGTSGVALNNNGNLAIQNCNFNGNSATSQGAAILNIGTITRLSDCNFTGNLAPFGAVIYNAGTLSSISNCTFAGNGISGGSNGGAIFNNATIVSITNSTFTGCSASSGAAIDNYYGGNISYISDCTFKNNSATYGAIFNYATIGTISNSTFTGNNAYFAGVINNMGNIALIIGVNFLNNTATYDYAGAIFNSGNITITESSFSGNKAATNGGAIYTSGTSAITTVHFSSFVNNTAKTGSTIYANSGTINATNNWWGSNSNPASQFYGTVDYSNWLYMTETVNPTAIINGNTATVTVSFNNIWNGTAVVSIDPASGHIVDGTLVKFSSLLGSLNHLTAGTVNGVATCVFTALDLGAGFVNATTNSQTVSSNVTVVGIVNDRTNATYTSIQAMIDDVNTLAGDTITFYTGSYTENIVLSKSLVFNASGVVHLIPLDASQPVLTITSSGSGSVIQGFIINGALSSSGVSLDSASNVTLVNNTINGNYVGVKFWNSTDNTIANNTVTGNVWSGICLDTSNANTISGNTVYGNQEGVFVANSVGNTVTNNTVSGNTYTGITVLGGRDNLIQGNNVQGNGVSGILIQGSANNNLTGNTVQNNSWSGICLDGATGNSLTGNSVSGNQEGIFAANSASGNTISDNTVSGNLGNGISVIQGSGNTVGNNTVVSNGVSGVFVQNSSSTVVNDNTIENNSWTGICLDQTTGTNVSGNTVSGNQEGIFVVGSQGTDIVANSVTNSTFTGISILGGSNDTVIIGNQVSGNGVSGILVQRSNLTTIQGNTLQKNSWSGVCLDQATNTSATVNNFENNPEQALAVGGSGNSFDSNYWSDWPYTFARPIDGDNNISDANPQTKPY
ncbi:PKD domain-containing protein [uncultured Methanobacterium sp.]|uniref:PKD domain-containing protein n=1 Tax=uncultured Methanobacterium sp. TaxID=176306 RepID=UPI002AA6AA41|nr:PKD domain-containing protein [uncultured Methanobacterium sp.]